MHPSLMKRFTALETACRIDGFKVRILETDRAPERQQILWNQGRSTAGEIVTHAKPYESAHNFGLAMDVIPVPVSKANWRLLRQRAVEVGYGIIGTWDPGHLQHPEWPAILAHLRKPWR